MNHGKFVTVQRLGQADVHVDKLLIGRFDLLAVGVKSLLGRSKCGIGGYIGDTQQRPGGKNSLVRTDAHFHSIGGSFAVAECGHFQGLFLGVLSVANVVNIVNAADRISIVRHRDVVGRIGVVIGGLL